MYTYKRSKTKNVSVQILNSFKKKVFKRKRIIKEKKIYR